MSFNEWKEVELGEILNFRRGHDLPKKNMKYGIYPVAGSNGIIGYHNEFTRKKPCVTIGRSGNVGTPYFYDTDCWAHNTTLYIDDFKGNFEKYIYYLLKTLNLSHYAGGSAVPTLNRNHIHPIKVKIATNVEEQKSIANILSNLDDKIEVNNKINQKLEEMEQAIFKQWFIDFDFPNEEGKPYKSSGGEMVESELGMIPKGWEVIKLDEIVETFNGYSYKGKELAESKYAMVTIKNFDRNGGYKLDGLKEIVISDKVKDHHYVELGDIIVAHTDLTQGAEIIGNPIIVTSKGKYEKLIMSMDTVKVKSKTKYISNNIIYLMLKDYRFKGFALGHMNGTTVLHLSKKAIPSYKIAIPNDSNLFIKLNNIIESLIIQQINLTKQIEKLEKTRDILLPKLMSGEIRVLTNN